LEPDSLSSAILAYYRSLIDAACRWLPPSAAAAIIRRLLDEQAVALRNEKDRQRTRNDNLRNSVASFPRSQLG
jgi:hypothetical protein